MEAVKQHIQSHQIAYLILAASFLLREIISSLIGPGFDEAYYHAFSLHLAGGYYDHPPLVAITAGLGRWLTGLQHPATLRFGAVLFFTIALGGIYHLTYALYGKKAAILSILIPHATPYFLVGAGAFVIPDNALMASWVWSLYVAFKIREGKVNPTLGFIILGLLSGLSLLAKYHAVLLPACLVVASFYDAKLRRWWIDPRLYLALIVAGIVFLPCILWNAQWDWISFKLQFGKAASDAFRLRFDLVGQALGGQLGYLTPWICVMLWIAVIKQNSSKISDKWLKVFFFLPIVIFTLLGFKRTILPHWTMPGYVAGFIFAGGYYARKLHDNISYPKWLHWTIGINLFLVLIVLIQAHTGVFPLPQKGDPTLDPVGWEETIEYLEDEKGLAGAQVLFAHKWFTGGELVWAARKKYDIVHIGKDAHAFAWWAPPQDYKGRNGYFITQHRHRLKERDIAKYIEPACQSFEIIKVPAVKRGRQMIEMQVIRMAGYKGVRLVDYGDND